MLLLRPDGRDREGLPLLRRQDPVKIEWDGKEPVECNCCGKVGRGRFLIWLGHLCKGFVGLCRRCYNRLKGRM